MVTLPRKEIVDSSARVEQVARRDARRIVIRIVGTGSRKTQARRSVIGSITLRDRMS